MIEVQGKHIVVVGAARSGIAVAILLQQKGAKVFVSDVGTISCSAKEKFNIYNIAFEEKRHSSNAEAGDFAVVSPGVPTEAPLVQTYLNANKKVFSEIEIASWFTNQPIVAITGSNGKTTVATWLAHIWETAQLDFSLAGNIGYAFSEKTGITKGTHILEVSSFQLDHIHGFKPDVSVLLNITPDHLNRYGNSIDAYVASKFRITENQTANNTFIFNFDDPLIKSHVESFLDKESKPQLWAFSNQHEVEQGAFIRNNHIIFKINNKEETLMPVHEIGLRGQHNVQNGLAAALAARAAEIKNEAIRESLKTFSGIEHRLEVVRQVNGVKYVNDSKATNINAVWLALDSYNVPITLILGGRDKGNDYSELIPKIKDKVHTIVAIGESKDNIEKQLGNVPLDFVKAETMREAIRVSKKGAKRGEVVLLSPACSSFDMFDDYEHRGKVFKEEVNKL